MTTGILAMLMSFASYTGTVQDNFVNDNMPRIKIVLNMVEKRLPWSCNVLWPLNTKDNRLLSLGVRCWEKINKTDEVYYNGRILMDIKTLSFIRIRDKKTLIIWK